MAQCEACPQEATAGVYQDAQGRWGMVTPTAPGYRDHPARAGVAVRWCKWHAHVASRLRNHPLPQEAAESA